MALLQVRNFPDETYGEITRVAKFNGERLKEISFNERSFIKLLAKQALSARILSLHAGGTPALPCQSSAMTPRES